MAKALDVQSVQASIFPVKPGANGQSQLLQNRLTAGTARRTIEFKSNEDIAWVPGTNVIIPLTYRTVDVNSKDIREFHAVHCSNHENCWWITLVYIDQMNENDSTPMAESFDLSDIQVTVFPIKPGADRTKLLRNDLTAGTDLRTIEFKTNDNVAWIPGTRCIVTQAGLKTFEIDPQDMREFHAIDCSNHENCWRISLAFIDRTVEVNA
jgi:uncharacterized protein (DUF1684 family)